MLQFKNYLIPIFVGLLNISRAYGECAISKDSNGIYNAAGCTANSYYLIKSDASILTTAAEDGIETILLNCENATGACSKVTVPGFYVNGAAANSYVECNSSNRCNIATVSNDACGDSNVGKLTSNGSYGLCLEFPKYGGGKNYVNRGFADTNETYLIQHKQGTIFSFDKSANYYCLKVTDKSITFDKECGNITDLVDQCALYDEGKIIDRLTDFCNDKSSYRYYTCTYGKCISESQDPGNPKDDNNEGEECSISPKDGGGYEITDECKHKGYYLYTDRICKYDDKLDCKTFSNIPKGFYWNAYKYSDVIKCTGTTCEKKTIKCTGTTCEKKPLGKSCTNEAGEVIDNGYNLEYCTSTTDSVLLLKDKEFEIDGIKDTVFSKKTFLKVDGYSLVEDKVTCDIYNPTFMCNGYYLDGNLSSNNLKLCQKENNKVTCNEVPNPLGYFVNIDSGIYFRCKVNASNGYYCNEEKTINDLTCTVGQLIKIDNDVKLCLSNNEYIGFGTNENKYFLKASVLNDSSGEEYYIVVIKSDSIQPVTLTPEDMHYKYTFKGSYEVLKDDSNACKNGKTSDDLVEYTKNNDNTYTKES